MARGVRLASCRVASVKVRSPMSGSFLPIPPRFADWPLETRRRTERRSTAKTMICRLAVRGVRQGVRGLWLRLLATIPCR